MAKFIDSDGIQRFKDKILALIPTKYAGSPTAGGIANKTMAIPHGKVNSGSTSTVMTATVDGITELRDGVCAMITNGVVTSASGWTLNVNSLGAKPVYGTMSASGRITTTFNSAYTMLFVYNETRVSGGCWDMYYGYNAGYTNNVQQGQGYGTCSTAEATKAKTVAISSYSLVAYGIISVHFTHGVPAGSTLNVNSKGAKAIYYQGTAITDGIIHAGDTATFMYSSHYHLIAIDRANPTKTSELTNDSGFITSASVPTKVSELTNDAGYTTNTGTITGITMNGVNQGTSGVVDLGNVMTGNASDYVLTSNLGTVIQEECGKKVAILSVNESSVALLHGDGRNITFELLARFWIPNGLEVLYVQILNEATDFTQANARLYELTDLDMTTASIRLTCVEDGTIYTADLQDTGSGLVGTISFQAVPKKSSVGEVTISGTAEDIVGYEKNTLYGISGLQINWGDYPTDLDSFIFLPDINGFNTGVQSVMEDVAQTYATRASVNGKADKDKVGEITINDTEYDITNYEKVTLNGISGVRMTCVNTASTPQALTNIFLPDIDGVTTASQTIISQIPTATSQLTNDSGFITASAISSIVGLEAFTNWTSGSHDANDAPIGLARVIGYHNNVTNLPWNIVGAYGFLLTIGGAQKIQIAARTNASGIHSVYMRHYNGTDWYPWATIYDSTAVYTNANEVSY